MLLAECVLDHLIGSTSIKSCLVLPMGAQCVGRGTFMAQFLVVALSGQTLEGFSTDGFRCFFRTHERARNACWCGLWALFGESIHPHNKPDMLGRVPVCPSLGPFARDTSHAVALHDVLFSAVRRSCS